MYTYATFVGPKWGGWLVSDMYWSTLAGVVTYMATLAKAENASGGSVLARRTVADVRDDSGGPSILVP